MTRSPDRGITDFKKNNKIIKIIKNPSHEFGSILSRDFFTAFLIESFFILQRMSVFLCQ